MVGFSDRDETMYFVLGLLERSVQNVLGAVVLLRFVEYVGLVQRRVK